LINKEFFKFLGIHFDLFRQFFCFGAPILFLLACSIAASATEEKPALVKFDLPTFLKTAMLSSPEAAILAKQLKSETFNYRQNKNYYIPTLAFEPKLTRDKVQSSSTIQEVDTIDENELSSELTLSQELPLGSSVSLSYDNSWRETNDASSVFNPQLSSDLSLTFSQPLLKGFYNNSSIYDLELSRIELAIEQRSIHQQVLTLVAEIIDTYWNLYLAQEDLKNQGESVSRAESQFDSTREYIEKGILPRSDIYIVEENLIAFQNQFLDAKNKLNLRLREFNKFVSAPADQMPVLTDKPQSNLSLLESETAMLATLKNQYAPYLEAKLAYEKSMLTWKYQKNQTLPVLDLLLQMSLSGVSDNFENASSQLTGTDNYSALFGLTFESPVTFRYLKEKKLKAQMDMEIKGLELAKAERDMPILLKNQLDDFWLREKQFHLSSQIAELAEKKLKAEEEKYKAGIARLTDLVVFQKQLDQARREVLRILIEWHKSYNQLFVTLGTLDEKYGLPLIHLP
jgi:outer membrane protein TolC